MHKIVVRFLCLIFVIFLSGCESNSKPEYVFHTELTESQHLENIRRRTSEKYESLIAEGIIKSFRVEILYAFDEQPEYFLVEFDGFEDYTYGNSVSNSGNGKMPVVDYAYLIGFIMSDRYYTIIYYHKPKLEQSPYRRNGYLDARKYCSLSTIAVQIGEMIVCLEQSEKDLNGFFCDRNLIVSEKEKPGLTKHRYRPGAKEY